jgi:hypothetical protein
VKLSSDSPRHRSSEDRERGIIGLEDAGLRKSLWRAGAIVRVAIRRFFGTFALSKALVEAVSPTAAVRVRRTGPLSSRLRITINLPFSHLHHLLQRRILARISLGSALSINDALLL